MRELYGGGGFRGGRRRRSPRAASTSATCCATAPAGRRLRRPVRRPLRRRGGGRSRPARARSAGPTSRRSATISFTDAHRRRHDQPPADLATRPARRATAPAASPAPRRKICPECEGAGFVVSSDRRRLLDQRDLPRVRRPPARLRRGVPDLPRLRPRHVRPHDPGPHPGRGQGRPADPAARQGRRRRERRPRRRPVRHRAGHARTGSSAARATT